MKYKVGDIVYISKDLMVNKHYGGIMYKKHMSGLSEITQVCEEDKTYRTAIGFWITDEMIDDFETQYQAGVAKYKIKIAKFTEEVIGFASFSQKPDRDTIINHEDTINLKIALNTAKSLDEFLALT